MRAERPESAAVPAAAALAALAGLLLTAALPPFGWWPLALAGAALLARLLRDRPWPARLLVGQLTGMGFLIPGLFWMSEFTLPGYVLASVFLSTFWAVGAVLVPPGRWSALGLPAALVLVEWLRGTFPFEGVPVATLAQTQLGGPGAEAARLGGPLLVAAAVGAVGAAIGLRRVVPLVVAVALALGGWVSPDGTADGELTAAIVQGGGPRGTRAIDTDEREVFQRHLDATEGVGEGVDLVLWPEDVVDVDRLVTETEEGETLADIAETAEATLVAGVVTGTSDIFVNEAWWWAADGTPGGSYEKNVRVPFGEWIPFRSFVSRLGDVSAVPRDMRVGTGPGVLETDTGQLGVVVSWEVFFARRARVADGDVLLNPTNAASFTTGQMPALEVGAARLRAIETGRWVLQAAPTGPTTVIDHRGRVHRQTDLGARAVITETVERRSGDTPYRRIGDVPLLVAAVVALAAAWGLTRRSGA